LFVITTASISKAWRARTPLRSRSCNGKKAGARAARLLFLAATALAKAFRPHRSRSRRQASQTRRNGSGQAPWHRPRALPEIGCFPRPRDFDAARKACCRQPARMRASSHPALSGLASAKARPETPKIRRETSRSPSPLVGEGVAHERKRVLRRKGGVHDQQPPLQSSDADASADSFPHKGGSGRLSSAPEPGPMSSIMLPSGSRI